jgi:hypothetical protein
MKGISAQWYVCKVRLDRTQENGTVKKVTVAYAVDAVDFTEAEARTTEEVAQYVTGEFEVKHISPAPFKEVVFDDLYSPDMRYYDVKIVALFLDEKSGREKQTNVRFLVQAPYASAAIDNLGEYMKDTMFDYRVAAVSETTIEDIITKQEL